MPRTNGAGRESAAPEVPLALRHSRICGTTTCRRLALQAWPHVQIRGRRDSCSHSRAPARHATFELSGTERTRRPLLPAWPPDVVKPSSKRTTPTSKSTLLHLQAADLTHARACLGRECEYRLVERSVRLSDEPVHLLRRVETQLALTLDLMWLPLPRESRTGGMCAKDSAQYAPVVIERVPRSLRGHQLAPDGYEVAVRERVERTLGPRPTATPRTLGQAVADPPVVDKGRSSEPLLVLAVAKESVERRPERPARIGSVSRMFGCERFSVAQRVALGQDSPLPDGPFLSTLGRAPNGNPSPMAGGSA